MSAPPRFGTREEGVTYRSRPAAYAVVLDGGGRVAVEHANPQAVGAVLVARDEHDPGAVGRDREPEPQVEPGVLGWQ